MVINGKIAENFATQWVNAWNAHDIDQILSHYTEDFEMFSPVIAARMGIASGMLKGKAAMREYWLLGLDRNPALHFSIINVLMGVCSITINYEGHKGLSAETFFLNDEGKVYRAYAHYVSCI